jgi:hypothetical protein
MRYLLALMAFLSLSLYAVDTVADNNCPSGNCKESQAPQQSEQTVQTTHVNDDGMVEIADNSSTAQTSSQSGSATPVLRPNKTVIISVVGQGVAPVNTTSPAQAYALAKRAAIADGYRLIAEKVRGVEVEGQDLIQNMMVKRSTVRTAVNAMVRNANVVETTFRDGLCEVEMEIRLSYEAFAH